MCYGKIVHNSHSRVEQTLTLHNHGMPAAPAQYKPMVLNIFTDGSQIQIYDFVRESH